MADDEDDVDIDAVIEFENDVMEESDSEAMSDEGDEPDEEPEDSHNKKSMERAISYDLSLPRNHTYLGNDLVEVSGRTIHDDDSFIYLPVLSLPGVVLMPGQTLPLHLFRARDIEMIKRVLEGDRTFGQINSSVRESELGANVGTTAEVLAVKEEEHSQSGLCATSVKAIGRQRFQVLETRRDIVDSLNAKVKILPEKDLLNPLAELTSTAVKRICYSRVKSEENRNLKAILSESLKECRRPKVDRFTASSLTSWPAWVYKQFDHLYLMTEIKKELRSWNETFENDAPGDASSFSFWVASLLPLDDTMKLELLKINCSIQRLRYELSVMKRCTVLCCRRCSQIIANKNEMFSMSVEGPLGAYVNPGGFVHETLTLYKAHGLSLIGRPSEESSWFPGYAWTIAQCRRCHNHMGWKFTVASDPLLKPDKFWGLCRSSLVPSLRNDTDDVDEPFVPIL